MKRLVIFTDLDGTLLDASTYSFEAALPALELIREYNVPLVLCSSKTRTEIEHYRKRIDNRHPFISENGGGIFIPKGYFGVGFQFSGIKFEEENNYQVMRLGAGYSDLREALQALRGEGFAVKGFGDMTAPEIAAVAGISVEEAEMARVRDFDEPFLFEGDEEDRSRMLQSISTKGFHYTKGRFHHIIGDSDKGKAVSILASLYRKQGGDIMTVALGDSPNDLPMLEKVDRPIIVQKPGGRYDDSLAIKNFERTDGIGPAGWNKAVISLLWD